MDEDKEILISIKVDNEAAKKNIEEQTLEITKLSDANTKLKNKNKELAKSEKDTTVERAKNSEEIAKNNLAISQANTTRKNSITTLKQEANSLGAVKANLRKAGLARDKVNLSTKAGQARYAELTQEINNYNTTLKKAEAQGNSFTRNVGNYSNGIQDAAGEIGKINPAIGGMINGFVGATKAALAFIATPIGLILAAVAAALAAVVSYFQRTEGGADKLAVGMAYLTGTLEAVMDVVAGLGKLLFDVFVSGFNLIANQFKISGLVMKEVILGINVAYQKVFGSVEDYEKAQKELADNTNQIIKLGKEQIQIVKDTTKAVIEDTVAVVDSIAKTKTKIAQTAEQQRKENELNKIRRVTTITSAEANRQIFEGLKLAKDETKSFAERRKGLEEAGAAEQKLSDDRLKIAKRERDLIVLRDAINDSTAEAKQEAADAEAAVIDAQTASLRTQTKIQASKITLIKQEEAARNKVTNDAIKQEEEKVVKAEELAVRTKDAELELTIAKKEAAAEDITNAQNKAFALTEIEQLKLQQQLSDETLLTADIELLKFESGERIAQFRENAALQESDRKKRQASEDEKLAKEEINRQKQVANAKMSLVNSAFELAKTVGAKDEKVQKALAIAQVIKNTAVGVSKAFTLPPPASYIQAAAVGISGASSLASIANSSSGGGASAPSVPSGGGGSSTPIADTSQADNALSQQSALEDAISNLGLTVSVTEINDAQNNVQLSEANSTI